MLPRQMHDRKLRTRGCASLVPCCLVAEILACLTLAQNKETTKVRVNFACRSVNTEVEASPSFISLDTFYGFDNR